MSARLASKSEPTSPAIDASFPRPPSGHNRKMPFRAGMGMTPYSPQRGSPRSPHIRAPSNSSVRTKGSNTDASSGGKSGQPRRRRYNDTRDLDLIAQEMSAEHRIMRSRAASGAATPMRFEPETPRSPSTDSLLAAEAFRGTSHNGSVPPSPYAMSPYSMSQPSLRGGLASNMSLQTLPTRPGPGDSALSLSLFDAFPAGVNPSQSASRRVNIPEGMDVGFNDNPYPSIMRSRTEVDLIPPLPSDASSVRSPGLLSSPGGSTAPAPQPNSPSVPSSPSSPVLVMSMNDTDAQRSPKVPSTRRNFLRSLHLGDADKAKSRFDSARSLPMHEEFGPSVPTGARIATSPKPMLEPVPDKPAEEAANDSADRAASSTLQPPPPDQDGRISASSGTPTMRGATSQASLASAAKMHGVPRKTSALATATPDDQRAMSPPGEAPEQPAAVTASAARETDAMPEQPTATAAPAPASSSEQASTPASAPGASSQVPPTGKNTAKSKSNPISKLKRSLGSLFRRKNKKSEKTPPQSKTAVKKTASPAAKEDTPTVATQEPSSAVQQDNASLPEPSAPIRDTEESVHPAPSSGRSSSDPSPEPPTPNPVAMSSGLSQQATPQPSGTPSRTGTPTAARPETSDAVDVAEHPSESQMQTVVAPPQTGSQSYDAPAAAASSPPTEQGPGSESIAMADGECPQATVPEPSSDSQAPRLAPALTSPGSWQPWNLTQTMGPRSEQPPASSPPMPDASDAPLAVEPIMLQPPISLNAVPTPHTAPDEVASDTGQAEAQSLQPAAPISLHSFADPSSIASATASSSPRRTSPPASPPEPPTDRKAEVEFSPTTVSVHGEAFDDRGDNAQRTPKNVRSAQEMRSLGELTETPVAAAAATPSSAEQPYGGSYRLSATSTTPAWPQASEDLHMAPSTPTTLPLKSSRRPTYLSMHHPGASMDSTSPDGSEDPSSAVSMDKLAQLIEQTMISSPTRSMTSDMSSSPPKRPGKRKSRAMRGTSMGHRSQDLSIDSTLTHQTFVSGETGPIR